VFLYKTRNEIERSAQSSLKRRPAGSKFRISPVVTSDSRNTQSRTQANVLFDLKLTT
jgi:hypothetical protein